jgi:hypothetical protein
VVPPRKIKYEPKASYRAIDDLRNSSSALLRSALMTPSTTGKAGRNTAPKTNLQQAAFSRQNFAEIALVN